MRHLKSGRHFNRDANARKALMRNLCTSLIEHGRITEPVRAAQLIGNGPEVLRRIDAVGRDFDTWAGTCGKNGQGVPVSSGQPTLRVAELTVGGTARA